MPQDDHSAEDLSRLLTELPGLLRRWLGLVDGAWGRLAGDCGANGELDHGLLESRQIECYELALALGDLCAAEAMIKHSPPLGDQQLRDALTVLLAAESVHAARGRLGRLPARLELSGELEALSADPVNRSLLALGLDPCFQARLGARIAEDRVCELDAGLDEDKLLLSRSARRLADEVVAPLAESIHREDRDIPETVIEQAAALGCFGSCIPERYGGSQPDEGADSLGMVVITEELSRASLGAAGSLVTRPEITARALLEGGSERQRAHWLPRLASGETLCAIAITEPDAGSDVAAISLRATQTQGGWLLKGSKTWSTFAGRSELLLVLARSEPGTSGYQGLSLFLVEKPKYPGHTFKHEQENGGRVSGRAIPTLGYRGMHSFELFFEDYFVPAGNLLGEESGRGRGFYYTMAGFVGGRLQTAARATGLMQAAFERALAFAGDRRAFGKPIADLPLTQAKLARMLATVSACRQFSHTVARELDDGGDPMRASLVKLFACRAAEWLTREAMQIHGGMGYAEESAVSRYFVDARVLTLFEGSEEILAIRVIARDLILRKARLASA